MRCVLHAVIWKNLLLRRNHWVQTLLEIAIPISMMLMVNLFLPSIPSFSSDQEAVLISSKKGRAIIQHNDRVIFSPDNDFTHDLMANASAICGYKKSNVKPGVISENGSYSYGIDFWNSEEDDSEPDGLNFTVYPRKYVWPLNFPLWRTKGVFAPSYLNDFDLLEFTRLYYSLEEAYLSMSSDQSLRLNKIEYQEMEHLREDIGIYQVVAVFSVFFAYSFLIVPAMTRIVEEKDSGAKELMLMMGVSSWELWLAKLVDALLVIFTVMTCLVFLMYVPLTADSVVLHHVSPLTLWCVLVAGMMAVLFFLFFLSCLFDNATFAALCATLIGMISAIVVGFVQVSEMAKWQKLLYCLLPHMSLIYGTQIILDFEFYEKKVKFFEQLSPSESALCLADVLMMVILDITLYWVLTWYFDRIRPGKFGVPQPYLFFIKKSYWIQNQKRRINAPKPNEGQQSGISVKNLRKEFRVRGRPIVVAVDNVSMEVPAGGITALLGHNGAGKSTTMSIITGLIPATSGTVLINGYNIQEAPRLARRSLGLCPQQDLLFADLTSIQVLEFFGMIKGMTRSEARRDALRLLKLLKMENAVNRNTQDLSGGMKRKVSLAIALIGGSSVVILDEPTSGVDPELRREICDLLLTFRGKRTILLTTHIMEEADAVSDQIVILDHGKVQCSGTPLDLKTRFGTGYTLSIVINESGDEKLLVNSVKEFVPGARFKARNAANLTFQLPEAQTTKFPELFQYLDSQKKSNEIGSYSVSISTLEDVFVRVREIETESENERDEDEVDSSTPYGLLRSNTELSDSKHVGVALLLSQLAALFIKRSIELSRSLIEFALYVGIPLFIIILGTLVAPEIAKMMTPELVTEPSFINYSAPLYPGTEILYASEDKCALCNAIADAFEDIAEGRGFRVTSSQDLDFDIKSIFLEDYHQYSRYLFMAVNFTESKIEVVHNILALHAVPVAMDLIHNAALKAIGGSDRIVAAVNLSYVSQRPDAYDYNLGSVSEKDSSFQDVSGLQTLFYMSAIFLETRHGAKALQLMAVNPAVYWLSHLLFDLLTYLPYIMIVIGLFGVSDPEDSIFNNGGHLSIAVIFWGTGMIQISYLITCFTKTKTNAIMIALFVYSVFSFFIWPSVIMQALPKWVAYLHPTCIWKLGLLSYGTVHEGMYLLHLFLYSLALFIFLCFYDSRIAGRVFHFLANVVCRMNYESVIENDPDVAHETAAVDEIWDKPDQLQNTLIVKSLRRWYGFFRRRPAVRGVSFRVVPGECFGLLGVNGAGKSTTFNMLTAQIACSDGDAKVNSKHLASLVADPYLSYISYCPQSSGIIPLLSGRQFLELFTRLRGFKALQVADTVHTWISSLDLQESADRECGRYSGGTERKLSAAVAFLWDASIVMLDEPSSGVDPVARRCIWKAVSSSQKMGKSVVLTSHSMDECEALCSKLAIMVSGSFRCIGETTTLKNKFGAGYSVQMKLGAGTEEEHTQFQNAVLETLGPDCRLTDQHCSILHYHVSDKETNWKTLFTQLEELKRNHQIFESYMASETTLEEIFLSFAGKRRGLGNVECVDLS